MDLDLADELAAELCAILDPYCERLEVAGSIRRRKDFCNDIDIVLIPKNLLALYQFLAYACQHDFAIVKWGPKLASLTYQSVLSVQVDLYFATLETWATLLLIRTGSKENNIRLCKAAQKKGWKLKADGSGLFDGSKKRVAGDEESIYEALGLEYEEPTERE